MCPCLGFNGDFWGPSGPFTAPPNASGTTEKHENSQVSLLGHCEFWKGKQKKIVLMTVPENKDVWSIRVSTAFTSFEMQFKLGQEFTNQTPDGRMCKTTVQREGDKFICTQRAIDPQRQSTRFVQEFFEDKCVVTLEIIGSDIKCQEVFMRKWARGALWNQWLWTKHIKKPTYSQFLNISSVTIQFSLIKQCYFNFEWSHFCIW